MAWLACMQTCRPTHVAFLQINLKDVLDVLDPDIPLTRGNNSVTQLAAVQTVTGVVFTAALKDAQKDRVRRILTHLKVRYRAVSCLRLRLKMAA